jgi:hypothetical protein
MEMTKFNQVDRDYKKFSFAPVYFPSLPVLEVQGAGHFLDAQVLDLFTSLCEFGRWSRSINDQDLFLYFRVADVIADARRWIMNNWGWRYKVRVLKMRI